MQTIYCIAMEGEGPTGVNWYYKKEDRDQNIGKTGAYEEVVYEMQIGDDLPYDKITEVADDYAWNMGWLGTPHETKVLVT